MKTIKFILHIPRKLIAGLILIYQKTLSPDHGPLSKLLPYPTCRFHPTCSEYGRGVILKLGVIRGVPLTVWRVLRCNPWSAGGEDPIPEK